MPHECECFREYEKGNSLIGTAKRGVGLQVIGEGCLPIKIKNPEGKVVNLDLETKHAPSVRVGLWGIIPLVDADMYVVFFKDKAEIKDDEDNLIF
jgi:hypothetical protein